MTSKTYHVNRQKRAVVTGALTATLIALSGCDLKKPEEEKTKNIITSEFSLLDKKIFNNHADTKNLTVSRDGQQVYLTVNGEKDLYHGDATDLQSEKGWQKIALATGLSGGAGEAELATAKSVAGIVAAKDGALVTVWGRDTDLLANPKKFGVDNGAFYVRGKTHKAAWSSRPLDVDIATPAAADKMWENAPLLGLLVAKAADDAPYLISGDATGAWIGMTKPDLTPAKATALVKRVPTGFASIPSLIEGGDYLFAVQGDGVTAMDKATIGSAGDFPDVAAATAAAGTGVAGSDHFKMEPGYANNAVTSVAVAGSHLYIGLDSGKTDFDGGVAVYEIKPKGTAPEIKAPAKEWKGIAVKSLSKDADGRVWAVTAKNIWQAMPDGKKGVSYIDTRTEADQSFDNAKDGYKKDSFPSEGITGAAFVNGKLVISTDKGLLVVKETQKTIVRP